MSLHPRTRSGLVCPDDPAHDALIPWTGSDRFGWYCPHQGHDDAGTLPFFTTAEAEAGRPVMHRRAGADTPGSALRSGADFSRATGGVGAETAPVRSVEGAATEPAVMPDVAEAGGLDERRLATALGFGL